MNRKFSTLMAIAMLATGANGWAQVRIDAASTTTDGYTVRASAAGALFNQFVQEDASSRGNKLFPAVSPFELKTTYGAKPISSLQHVNGVADGRYFQFAISESFHAASAVAGDGKEVLTMVWVDADNATSGQGHFEVQVENVNNANVSNNRITLDRTLWKVTANKDAAGTVLYYQLQNKASEAIMQLSIDKVVGTPNAAGEAEIALEVVNGQTNWRWADGQVASVNSKIEPTAGTVLQNQLRAQYNNGMTIRLARKVASGGEITLGAVKMNSNKAFAVNTDAVTINGATFYPVTFESWEANPIILTADQINAELGNEVLLTEDKKTPNRFNFVFDPDVQGDTNVMLSGAFKAENAKSGFDRVPGDTPDGYVRFVTNATKNESSEFKKEYLHVDTAYYDPNPNGRYDLKLTVGQILYPRYAVAADGRTVNSDGELMMGGSVMTDAQKYGDLLGATAADKLSKAPNTMSAYTQLKRQSNFRPIFYPSTQSLRLQAEMLYKADKNNSASWWEQMAKDAAGTAVGTSVAANWAAGTIGTDYTMLIAECAADPSIDPVNKRGAARGYYPSYAQEIASVKQGNRLLHYLSPWAVTDMTDVTKRNGYATNGLEDVNVMLWNAVGNVLQENKAVATALSAAFDAASTGDQNVWVLDPASTVTTTNMAEFKTANPNEVAAADAGLMLIYAPQYASAHSNLARLVTLTPTHVVLTAGPHDVNDAKYNGLLTYITLKTTKTESDLNEVADIAEGFYYIRNAKKLSSDLTKEGDYRYEDLAATNATFTYWNAMTQKWDRGDVQNGNNPNNTGINADMHKNDLSNIGNLVYSEDKKVIPSAQWYVKGNGGYYTIINRESGRTWGTSYWWKTSEPNTYANMATYYDAAGLMQTYRDTIRIEMIPQAELTNRTMGYLDMTQAEAIADTSVYAIGMKNLGDTHFSLTSVDGVLKLVQDAKGEYKMERVLVKDKDIYSQKTMGTDELIYGYVPAKGNAVDTAKMLVRAKYYIYKDEVNANSGIEPSSIKTRQYITLESGKYRLTSIQVKFDDNLFSTNLDADEMSGTENVKNRRAFYVKQISTEDPTQFVLVDPLVVTQTGNGTSTKTAYGARLFVNQMTAEVQPSSLISDGYANSYASSIFSVEKQQAFNYKDLRGEFSRDTLEFFKADDAAGNYLLSENTVKGANVGLLESLDKNLGKNNAIFLDTANVSRPECPRFLLGLRNVDTYEQNSSIPEHNRHLFTEAAYLVNMIDSVSANPVYMYKNIDQNSTKYYRLGFVNAKHEGSKLTFDKSGAEYDLSDAALGENGLNYATFAFRYCDAERENFYIETMYDKDTRGWLKTINHVLVVTPEIQEAEVFQAKKSEGAPTANEEITASSVTVVGGNGIVTIKGAAAKKVTVCNVLGQTLASTVLSSDDATIAVPAGIVVVAVEGEAAVKAVVK